MFFPWVTTCAPETPSPLTRAVRTATVSVMSAFEGCPCGWYTTERPPARSRPKRGVHERETTAAKAPTVRIIEARRLRTRLLAEERFFLFLVATGPI